MIDKRYYFDIGGTPLSAAARQAVEKVLLNDYANPEALHEPGQKANGILNLARQKLANLINASSSEEIIFTSGATESDNLAIKGVALQHYLATQGKLSKPHLLISSIEHAAIRQSALSLEGFGFQVEFIPVSAKGMIEPDVVAQLIKPTTLLVSVMAGNNQFGTIQDIVAIGQITSNKGVYFHTDASVFFGVYPLDVQKAHLDLATISSAKIYGPKGVAALYCRRGVPLYPLFHGGHQEAGKRAGTHNLPAIVGFVTAAEKSLQNRQQRLAHDQQLSEYFINQVKKTIPYVLVNGDSKKRLVGNVHLSVLGAEGESLVLGLASYGIAATTGSACSSKSLQADPALKALGLTPELVHGSLRFFWHPWHTQKDLDYLLDKLKIVITKLRQISAYKPKESDVKK